MTWKLFVSSDSGANQFWHETNQLELSNAEAQVKRMYGDDVVVVNQEFKVRDDD